MTDRSLHDTAVAKVAETYRRRGYDVVIAPGAGTLPEFLEGASPDLIARASTESVVVEVKVGTRTSVAEKWGDLAQRIQRQSGWRFELVFVDPRDPEPVFEGPKPSLAALEERARNAGTLLQGTQSEAAFLLLWSALEGALRLIAERATLPLATLPTSALLRELYSAGEISRDHFEEALRLLPIRDQLSHGSGQLDRDDTEHLQRLVQGLLTEVRAA